MEGGFYEIFPGKKQKEHFVPKWYLRNFSSTPDQGHIWVYTTETKKIKQEPINLVAQKQGFYGKEFEDSLDPIDTRTKRVIENIILSENIDGLTSTQETTLHEFFTLQYYRTEHAKKLVENQLEFTIKFQMVPKLKQSYKHIAEKDFVSILSEPPTPNFFLLNIDMALCSIKALSDLTPYLIKNNTNVPFFTSDDPVAFNNRYHVPNKFLIGLHSVGLQIFCPINERYSIMLIHREAYDLKNSDRSLIKLTSKKDVDLFNKLQILDSHFQIFSKKNSLSYIQHLHKESEMMKKSKGFDIKLQNEIPSEIKEYKKVERRDYGLQFSFLERNKNFVRNEWPKCLRESQSSKTAFVRNKEIYDEVMANTDSFISSFLKNYQSMMEQKVTQLDSKTISVKHPRYINQT